MIVFINDRPIRLVGPKAAAQLTQLVSLGKFSSTGQTLTEFDHFVDARLEVLKEDALHGHLLVLNATTATVDKLLSLLQKADASRLFS
jgi:hypothetical protein